MSQRQHIMSQRGHGKPPGFFCNFFMLYLIFVLANPQPTQRVKTAMAATTAAVAARDVSRLELLVCFIFLLLH